MTCEQRPEGVRGSHRFKRGEGALSRGHSQSKGCGTGPGVLKEQRTLMECSE